MERENSSLTDDNAKRENEDKIEAADQKLYHLDKAQGELEKAVNEATKMVDDRLYIAKACRDARSGVLEVFGSALSSGNRESDPEIAPLAKQLVAAWEKSRPGHEQAVKEVNTVIEACDKTLYEIGHLGSF